MLYQWMYEKYWGSCVQTLCVSVLQFWSICEKWRCVTQKTLCLHVLLFWGVRSDSSTELSPRLYSIKTYNTCSSFFWCTCSLRLQLFSAIFSMETSLLWHRAPLQVLRMTELFYSSIATDLDFPLALHSPVAFAPFAITVQTVNVVNQNLNSNF